MNYIIRQDGDQWFATADNFINLQESDVEWGDTPKNALDKLMNEIRTMKLVQEGRKHDFWGIPMDMLNPKYLGFNPRTYERGTDMGLDSPDTNNQATQSRNSNHKESKV